MSLFYDFEVKDEIGIMEYGLNQDISQPEHVDLEEKTSEFGIQRTLKHVDLEEKTAEFSIIRLYP